MWKLFCQFGIILLLSACHQKSVDIFSADDLNQFLADKTTKTFFVKQSFLQSTSCQEIENWARNHLPTSSQDYKTYYFVKYDDELTLKGNPWLKKDAGAIVTSYSMCSMNHDEKKCYYCRRR